MTAEAVPKSRSRKIRLHVGEDVLSLIDLGARLSGGTRAAFIVNAAQKAAEETLAEKTMFRVDPENLGRYLAVLDAQPGSEAFARLMKAAKPWQS